MTGVFEPVYGQLNSLISNCKWYYTFFYVLFFEKLAPKHRTGRKTFGFAWIDHPAEVLQAMDELGTDYVISVPSGKAVTHLHPVLHKYPDRFEAIHRHKIYKKYVIYRVLKP